jgi:hypothetical protein
LRQVCQAVSGERRTAALARVDPLPIQGLYANAIEEGGTEPTVPRLRHLAAALNATAHLTPGHDLGSVSFQILAA